MSHETVEDDDGKEVGGVGDEDGRPDRVEEGWRRAEDGCHCSI